MCKRGWDNIIPQRTVFPTTTARQHYETQRRETRDGYIWGVIFGMRATASVEYYTTVRLSSKSIGRSRKKDRRSPSHGKPAKLNIILQRWRFLYMYIRFPFLFLFFFIGGCFSPQVELEYYTLYYYVRTRLKSFVLSVGRFKRRIFEPGACFLPPSTFY